METSLSPCLETVENFSWGFAATGGEKERGALRAVLDLYKRRLG